VQGGYLPFNAGAAIHGPALEQKLAERILSERLVFALLEAVEDRPRDHAFPDMPNRPRANCPFPIRCSMPRT
jgi:hypothetical protein